ncbi:MAG: response regulator transcription factor [Saprospiraceae bacterium]|nr:response regulator transcription factor [Saprospiraceae bacterium]
MNFKVLVIDDERDVLDVVSYNLLNDGYQVETAGNGVEGLQKAEDFLPDLILLDIMMPDMDGIEVCRRLREQDRFDNILIAFLTARGEDYTQVMALDYGGDDFIIKPIKPNVLKSRIRALLRRTRRIEEDPGSVITLDDLSIDPEKFEVRLDDRKIDLAKKEFLILELLMSAPGKVFSRQEIFRRIWGSDVIVGQRTIDVHIRRIREKIGDKYIKTLKGVGYKLEA